MKAVLLFFTFSLFFSCQTKPKIDSNKDSKESIDKMLNQWHKDVATYNYDAYFNKMTENAVFVGTDASEVWSKQEFQSFCKPFFDKKQTWNFKPFKRNIYLKENVQTAWFDETLATWMGVCRGSGVLTKEGSDWKINHYVLSVIVPNEDINTVIKIKKERDSLYLQAKE